MTGDTRRYARGHLLAADAGAARAVQLAADRLGWDVTVETLTGGPAPARTAAVEGIRFADPLRVRLTAREGEREPDAADVLRALAGRADVWLDDGRALHR
ncbi:hypothetical protein ACIQLJ_00875 [Microbacterium sp. NPDC091313]